MARTVVVQRLVSILGFQIQNAPAATAAVNGVKNTAAKATKQVQGFASAIRGWFGALAAISIGRSILRDFWETNVTFQRLRQQLVTLTGSAERTTQIFAMIRRFAVNTPFEVAEVTSAFSTLTAVGFQPTEEQLTALGNVASGMGQRIEDLATAISRASVGLYRRLGRFGIQSRVMGDQVALTFRGVTTTIHRDLQSVTDYLVNLGNTQFAGGMDRQMNTLAGQASNLSDVISNMWYDMGEAGISSGLMEIIKGFQDLVKRIWPTMIVLGRVLKPIFSVIGFVLQFVAENLETIGVMLVWAFRGQIAAAAIRIVGIIATLGTTMSIASAATLLLQASLFLLPVALWLIYDDMEHWANGQKSLLADLAEDWRGQGGIKGAMADFLDWLHGEFVPGQEEASGLTVSSWWRATTGILDALTSVDTMMNRIGEGIMGLREIMAAIGIVPGVEELNAQWDQARINTEEITRQIADLQWRIDNNVATDRDRAEMTRLQRERGLSEIRRNAIGAQLDYLGNEVSAEDPQSYTHGVHEGMPTPVMNYEERMSTLHEMVRDAPTRRETQRIYNIYHTTDQVINVTPEEAQAIIAATHPPGGGEVSYRNSPEVQTWLDSLREVAQE